MILVSCTACGNSTDASKTSSEDSYNEEDLIEAVVLISEAEELVKSMASTQRTNWSKYSDIMSYYFVDEDYMNMNAVDSIAKRAEQLHDDDDRTAATEKLATTKNLMWTTGIGDFYSSVKEYYLVVNNYLSLVSTFPEGYSEMTFSSTVGDFNNDC